MPPPPLLVSECDAPLFVTSAMWSTGVMEWSELSEFTPAFGEALCPATLKVELLIDEGILSAMLCLWFCPGALTLTPCELAEVVIREVAGRIEEATDDRGFGTALGLEGSELGTYSSLF